MSCFVKGIPFTIITDEEDQIKFTFDKLDSLNFLPFLAWKIISAALNVATVILKEFSVLSKTIASCSEPSFISSPRWCGVNRSSWMHRKRLWFWLHHCFSAKPCDSYQETRIKRSALLHKGGNNTLQLGHETYSVACDLIGRTQEVCVHRETHTESGVTVNKFCTFLLKFSPHHLMVWPQSPTENKMQYTIAHPWLCNDATLGVIIMRCLENRVSFFLAFCIFYFNILKNTNDK